MARKKELSSIEGSPLLSKGGDVKLNSSMASPFHSSVNAEKFDMKRFTEHRSEEESSLKIIIYVVLVVIIGVGLALFVRQSVTNNTNETEEIQDVEEVEEEISVVNINTVQRSDALAVKSGAPELVFSQEETLSLGNSQSQSPIYLSGLSYDRYATFGQLLIELGDVTLETVPEINLSLNSEASILRLSFPDTTLENEQLTNTINVNDMVRSISYNQVSKTMTLILGASPQYRASLVNIGENTYLLVDIVSEVETVDQAAEIMPQETEGTPVVEQTQPEAQVNQPRPEGTNYDNQFSQEKQFITSNVSSNSINLNEVYYEDTGSHFEIAWGTVNKVGENLIPNAEAQLVVENGISYIDLTIKNLEGIQFNTINANQIPINMSAANFVSAERKDFSNGVINIRIQLKRTADFRLVSEPTVDGRTQVLAVQIKD